MPIMYVNPAKGRRRAKRRNATTTRKRKTRMAKPKRRKATTRRRKNAARKTTSSAKRKATARKAAATRKRNAAKRSAAAKKAARTRKRRMSAKSRTRNPARKRRRSTKRRRNSASKSRKRSMAAKRAWRSRRKSNPTRARKRRRAVSRRRRNPSRRKPAMGLKGVFKQAIPAVAALYGARVVGQMLTSGPLAGVASKVPANMGPAAVAALLTFGGHIATKKVKFLKKHRSGIMTGLGINLIDKIVAAVAPADLKSKVLGVGDSDVYGLSEYVAVDGYVDMSGAPPIDDNIALSEYVGVGGAEYDLGEFQSEMGMMEDLGVEMDLGAGHTDFADRHLGGFHRWQYRAPVARQKYLAPVPPRSFTAPVPQMTPAYDAAQGLYTGIFSGGF